MGAGHPKVSVAVNKSTPEQVHPEASVAMVMSMSQSQ